MVEKGFYLWLRFKCRAIFLKGGQSSATSTNSISQLWCRLVSQQTTCITQMQIEASNFVQKNLNKNDGLHDCWH